MNLVGLMFLCAAANAIESEVHNIIDYDESNDTRKYYGLSFNNKCKSYQRVFKCMSACKAMSYQVYRIDQRCKCTCHEMKTTTILPFFKWRTNGTTRAVPKTRSVRLYEIIGTIFPQPTTETEPEPKNETNFTCPTFDFNFTLTTPAPSAGNATGEDANKTDSAKPDGGKPGGEGGDDAKKPDAGGDDAKNPDTGGDNDGNKKPEPPKVTVEPKDVISSGAEGLAETALTFTCEGCTLEATDITCDGKAAPAGVTFTVDGTKITLAAVDAASFKNEMACVYMGKFKDKDGKDLDTVVVAVIDNGAESVKLTNGKQQKPLSEIKEADVVVDFTCEGGKKCKIDKVTRNGATLEPANYKAEPAELAEAGKLTFLKGVNELGVYQAVFSVEEATDPITKTVLEINLSPAKS